MRRIMPAMPSGIMGYGRENGLKWNWRKECFCAL